jgi:glucose-1-phosphate adenylyltransferase
MGNVSINGSLIADGCKIGDNVTIENSVIGLRTVIGDNVSIRDSVVMGADYIENTDSLDPSDIPVGIGSGSRICGAVLDKNCRVGKNVEITNSASVQHHGEDDALQIRDGISIVIKNGVIQDDFKN